MKFRRLLWTIALSGLFLSHPLYAFPVRGTITGPGGTPIAGATILISSTGSKAPVTIQTGADGRWQSDMPDVTTLPEGVAADDPYVDFVSAIVIAPGRGFGVKLGKRGDTFDISLPAAKAIGGTVQDEKGSPLAGVTVQLRGFYTSAFYSSPNQQESPIPFEMRGGTPNDTLSAALTTKTDAEGKWRFEGIPEGTRVFVALDDDRFSVPTVDVRSGSLEAVIQAKAGATLKGRVLLPDGQPAAGAQLYIGRSTNRGNESVLSPKTDADGRFTAVRLPAGDISLTVYSERKEWLTLGQEITDVKPGETRDLADIKLSAGIKVTGIVLDETGKPVSGASVRINGTPAKSGSDGRYTMQVDKGKNWLTASKDGYLGIGGDGGETQAEVTVRPDETAQELDPIKIQRGVYVSGTARTEAGEPATGVRFNSEPSWQNPAKAVVAKDGTFRFGPLFPGKEAVIRAGGTWDINKEVKVKAPTLAREAEAPKLDLVVKRIELLPVSGRIVDVEGAPLPDVKANFRIYNDSNRNSWSNVEATSDSKGTFSFGQLRPEQAPLLDKINSEQYVFVKAGAPQRDAKAWTLGDIVLSSLDGKASGQVVDAAGAPVQGAQIVIAGRYPFKPVVTGADGTFQFENLPRGEVTLLAAKDHAFAGQTIKTGPYARLVLQERPLPTRAEGENLLHSKLGNHSFSNVFPALDPDFAFSLILKRPDGTPSPWLIARLVVALARRDPAKAATWGLAQWEKVPAVARNTSNSATLASALIPVKREFAVQWLAQTRAALKPNDFSKEAADQYFYLAGVAGMLGDPSASDLLDLGLTATDQTVLGDKRIDAAQEWGRAVGTTPELIERLIQEMEPVEKVNALSGAISWLAKIDPDAALALLPRLTVLLKDPAVKAADARQEADRRNGVWRSSSGDLLGQAQKSLAIALSARPGPAAADMAKGIAEGYLRISAFLSLARRYAAVGRTADATTVLRYLASDSTHIQNDLVMGANLALGFDKNLAAELFAQEYKQIMDRDSGYSDDYRPTIAGYAYFHASLDPAQSRLLLENEWAWRNRERPDKTQQGNDEYYKQSLVSAMGVLDLPRALEMLGQIKEENYVDEAKWDIGLYLASDGKIGIFDGNFNDD
jgi:protocatechuate 3,4-dioxygenase beta subunit